MSFQTIAQVEQAHIAKVMAHLDGDKRSAAEVLGISLNTLYNRLNEYGDSFDWSAFSPPPVEPPPPAKPSALWFWDFEAPKLLRPPEEIVAQSIELHVGKICVYEHIRGDEVVYVGMGQWNRPFADSRNDNWLEEFRAYGPVQIRILSWFDDEREARAYEAEVIKYRQPRLNIMHNTPLQSFGFAALPA